MRQLVGWLKRRHKDRASKPKKLVTREEQRRMYYIYGLVGFFATLLIMRFILAPSTPDTVTVGFNCHAVDQSPQTESTSQPNATVKDDDVCETAQFLVAATAGERVKGLSGRTSSEETPGMLFVFDSDGQPGIWMKDMQFSLHLIWIDKDKKVVDIDYDVLPETYPETFKPNKSVRYLIELDASFSSEADLPFKIGDRLFF